jgi:bacterioferritin-associated ferredoxin
MYVCVCHAVTDRAIREASRRGIRTVDQLAMETGLGTCCGSCRPMADEILAESGVSEARVAFAVAHA